jgi:hypothetical protein
MAKAHDMRCQRDPTKVSMGDCLGGETKAGPARSGLVRSSCDIMHSASSKHSIEAEEDGADVIA